MVKKILSGLFAIAPLLFDSSSPSLFLGQLNKSYSMPPQSILELSCLDNQLELFSYRVRTYSSGGGGGEHEEFMIRFGEFNTSKFLDKEKARETYWHLKPEAANNFSWFPQREEELSPSWWYLERKEAGSYDFTITPLENVRAEEIGYIANLVFNQLPEEAKDLVAVVDIYEPEQHGLVALYDLRNRENTEYVFRLLNNAHQENRILAGCSASF